MVSQKEPFAIEGVVILYAGDQIDSGVRACACECACDESCGDDGCYNDYCECYRW